MELPVGDDDKLRYWSWCDGRPSWVVRADMMAGPLEFVGAATMTLQWWDHRRWKKGCKGGKGGLVGL
jgi:hypothetical protein